MRKSELLAIKAREYERGVEFTRQKFRISARDVQGWADEARDRVEDWHDWSPLEDAMREMLTEIGVEITDKQKP